MRLQELYFICKNACEDWPSLEVVDAPIKQPDGKPFRQISNWDKIIYNLDNLLPVKNLSGRIKMILELGSSDSGTIASLTTNQYASLNKEYSELFKQVKTIRDTCEALNVRGSEYGFDIRLPDGISLDEFSRCTRDLNNILSRYPAFADMDASVEFSSVDIGSTWLSFAVAGTCAVSFLGALAYLADRAVAVYSHVITCKQQDEMARALKISNDIIEEQHKAHSKITNALISSISETMNQKYGMVEPESLEDTKYCLKTLSDWMEKGLEIHAAINASQEVKAIFPSVEKQSLPEAVLKMLTETTEAE